MGVTRLDAVAVVDYNLVTVAAVAEFNELNRSAFCGKDKLTRSARTRNIKTRVPAASSAAVVGSNCIKTRNRPDKFTLNHNVVAAARIACFLRADLNFFAYRVNESYTVDFLGRNLYTVDISSQISNLVRTLYALADCARVTPEEL